MNHQGRAYSKEIELVLTLCRMVFSGVGSIDLNKLLTSDEWKYSEVTAKFEMLDRFIPHNKKGTYF